MKPGWALHRQVQAELRLREGFRQPRAANVQNATEFLRATQTKAIQAGPETSFPHSQPSAAANRIQPRAGQEQNYWTWTTPSLAPPKTGKVLRMRVALIFTICLTLGKILNFRALFFFSIK